MSGGSFFYAYRTPKRFAGDLRNRLDGLWRPLHDDLPSPAWPPEVAAKLAEIADLAEHASRLMREAEWLYSGDTGPETFMQRVSEIEATRK